MRVVKGHGTENDFVIIDDLDGTRGVSARFVRAVCDRRSGVGADGVLRLVRSAQDLDGRSMAAEAEYFMDYRNADGSIAQMCGNGVRLFALYLQRRGLAGEHIAVATRGGVKQVSAVGGLFVVDMGAPRATAGRPVVGAAPGLSSDATVVWMPNPHAVVEVPDEECLSALDLTRAPRVDPRLDPSGQNVEFVLRRGPRHLQMRVHERGVGETRSCGTGICAVVVAAASATGTARDGSEWRVDVPGGTCTVRWRVDDHLELCGPAQIVAEIDLDEEWLAALGASAVA